MILARCSAAQLRRGTGDDADDLAFFREACAAPALGALSEELGALRMRLVDAALRPPLHALTSGAADGAAAEAVEATLFGAACTSPRCGARGANGEGAEELALQLIGAHAEAVAGGGAGEAAQTQALAALCALAAALRAAERRSPPPQ